MTDPYASPSADLNHDAAVTNTRYAGFWIRVGASIIDTILIMLVIVPLLLLFVGSEVLEPGYTGFSVMALVINYVLPFVAIMLFWIYRSATPGKILLKLRIVDATDGSKPSTGRFILRYVGYFVSTMPLLLGLVWVAFDKRKQSWHDKIAKTVVVRD